MRGRRCMPCASWDSTTSPKGSHQTLACGNSRLRTARPAAACARHGRRTRMKVALLEASHWHVPLYLDPLETSGIEVVAVSDAEHVKGQAIAERFGSRLYSSSYELLDREKVDFAF